jgi:hypothetical protein
MLRSAFTGRPSKVEALMGLSSRQASSARAISDVDVVADQDSDRG